MLAVVGSHQGTAIGLPDPSLAAFLLLSSSAAGLGVPDHSGNIRQSLRYLSNQGDVQIGLATTVCACIYGLSVSMGNQFSTDHSATVG